MFVRATVDRRRIRRAGRVPNWRARYGPMSGLTFLVALALSAGGGQAAVAAEPAPSASEATIGVPLDNQFYSVSSRGTYLSVVEYGGVETHGLVTSDRSFWTSTTRPGLLRSRVLKTDFPATPRGERAAAMALRIHSILPAVAPSQSYFLGSTSLSRDDLLNYPTDPQVIYARLLTETAGRGHSPSHAVVDVITGWLREQPSTSALRAGMFGALALVPGVTAIGESTDSQGRKGPAYSFTDTGTRTEMIFDGATWELLAVRGVLVDPATAAVPLPRGTVVEDAVYLERKITDTASASAAAAKSAKAKKRKASARARRLAKQRAKHHAKRPR